MKGGRGDIFKWALRECLPGGDIEYSIPGWEESKCKGPVAGACLEYSWSFKNTSVAKVGWGDIVGNENPWRAWENHVGPCGEMKVLKLSPREVGNYSKVSRDP